MLTLILNCPSLKIMITFGEYPAFLKSLHLYMSKDTEERQRYWYASYPLLEQADVELGYHRNYGSKGTSRKVADFVDSVTKNLALLPDFEAHTLQYTYLLVDCLLVTPLLSGFDVPAVIEWSLDLLKQFVVLHEAAVLCWYDLKISPKVILDLFGKAELTQKEAFHILGEMSLRYPQETIEYVAATQLLNNEYVSRFVQKLYRARTKQLNKDFVPVGSVSDISTWLESVNLL